MNSKKKLNDRKRLENGVISRVFYNVLIGFYEVISFVLVGLSKKKNLNTIFFCVFGMKKKIE